MKNQNILKSFFLIITFILLPMNLRASDEINNLMPRTIWYVYCPNDNNCSFKSIQVLPTEKDKVFTFNGNEYCDVLVSPYPAFYDYYSNPDQFLVLHFRSEDSRVYCFDEEKKEDVLMFDYDLSLGDEVADGDGNRYKVVEVTNVGEITEYTELNDELKVFKLQGLDDQDREDIWIENVGSVKTGLLRESDYSDVRDTHLLFFNYSSVNPVISFALNYDNYKSMPFIKTFPYNEESIKEEDEKSIIEWLTHEKMNFEFIDDSLHVFGRSCLHRDPFDIMQCHIKGSTITVDIQQVHGLGGIEATDMRNYGYDVKLPGFKPGTYDIIFYEDNQKKETTITCLGSATIIKNIQEYSILMHSNAIYDLQGRRLDKIPERVVYIKNGKKLVK